MLCSARAWENSTCIVHPRTGWVQSVLTANLYVSCGHSSLTFCNRRAKSTLSSKFPSCIYDMQAGNLVGNKGFLCLLNFPLPVNEGKLVDKEIFCLSLNFQLAYHMYEGNLEDKGYISLLHEQWGTYEVYIPWEKKRIRGDHGIIILYFLLKIETFNVE